MYLGLTLNLNYYMNKLLLEDGNKFEVWEIYRFYTTTIL